MATLPDSFVADFDELSVNDAQVPAKQIHGIKEFHLTARRKGARSVRMKKIKDCDKSKVIAPNLSAMVGSAIAVKLVEAAGGLDSLANMSASRLARLGTTSQDGVGYIEQAEIIQTAAPALKARVSRHLVLESTLAIRADRIRADPCGSWGKLLRKEIRGRIKEWQKPHPQV